MKKDQFRGGFTPLHPARFNLDFRDEWQIQSSLLKKLRPQGRGVTGFTLMEIAVVLGIFGITVMAVGAFTTGIFRFNRVLTGQLDTETQLRRFVAKFSTESRTASVSSLGAYPIDAASATAITFYSNIDADSLKERVRYFLDGTTMKRGILKPTGSPLTYNPANEKVSSLVNDVRNGDIFSYYDDTYNGSSPPLTFPVTLTAIRLIRLKLSVDLNPNESPAPLEIETNVHLRNL